MALGEALMQICTWNSDKSSFPSLEVQMPGRFSGLPILFGDHTLGKISSRLTRQWERTSLPSHSKRVSGAHITGRCQPPATSGRVSSGFYESRKAQLWAPVGCGWHFSSPLQQSPWTGFEPPCLDSSHPGTSRELPWLPFSSPGPSNRWGSCPLSGFCPASSLSSVFISVHSLLVPQAWQPLSALSKNK